MIDRRGGQRVRTIYRPASIESARGLGFVVMRNVSRQGAQFDGVDGLSVGELVRYQVANSEKIPAKVVWIDGDKAGVENIRLIDDLTFAQDMPYRSVRLALNSPISFFKSGEKKPSNLRNISQKGACIDHDDQLCVGNTITLKLGDANVENVEVVWADQAQAGLRFSRALNPQLIRCILKTLQRRAHNGTSSEAIAA